MSSDSVPDFGLSPDEKAALEVIAHGDNLTLARRARIILLWNEGLEADDIALRVGLSTRTVNRWLQAFFENGPDIFPQEVLRSAQAIHREAEPVSSLEEPQPPARLTVAELCRRYHVDMAHAQHVARLAVELFNLTASLHRLDMRYRDTIFNAGILHNIAFAGGVAGHHTRGRDIILQNPLTDLDDFSRAIIAVTTAFHRKAWRASRPDKEAAYLALPPEARQPALVLAALVRIADGLDYSQSQTTVLGPCQAGPEGVLVTVSGPFAESDAFRADEKADMWRAVSGIPIRITPRAVGREINISGIGEALPSQTIPDAAVLARSPGILPDDRMSEAGRKALRLHFERMLYYEPGTRAGTDVEALHDMRVSTRRMRAAFRVFGDYYDPGLRRHLLRGLRRTGRTLGALRDLDVFLQNAQLYLAGLPAGRQNELDLFFEAWQRRREKVRNRLLKYLDSDDYRAFVEDFREFVSTPGMGSIDDQVDGPLPVLVRQIAPRQIYTRYEAVRAYEGILEHASITTLHALRIDGKRLRYTLEFFRETLGKEVDDVISIMVRVQDHLGALHDADVARIMLRRFMEKLLRQARRQQERSLEPVPLPELGGIVAFLEDRERQLAHLQQTFPEVWAAVVAPETRRRLALAVSIL